MLRCIPNGGTHILGLQLIVIGQNVSFGHARAEPVENIDNADSRTAHGRATTADVGVRDDTWMLEATSNHVLTVPENNAPQKQTAGSVASR
jgi:hypothetical protein